MGVGICFSRPGFFTAIAKNMTKIVLTSRQIYGVPGGPFFKDKARFQIPYDSIVSLEQLKYYLHKVLWIQYRDAEKTKEVSIICHAPNSEHASQAYQILLGNPHKP